MHKNKISHDKIQKYFKISRTQRGKIKIYLVKIDNSESLILSRNFVLHNFSVLTGIGIAEISSAVFNSYTIPIRLTPLWMPLVSNPKRSFVITLICCLLLLRLDGKGSSRTVGDWTSLVRRQSRSSSLLAETILSATIFSHLIQAIVFCNRPCHGFRRHLDE